MASKRGPIVDVQNIVENYTAFDDDQVALEEAQWIVNREEGVYGVIRINKKYYAVPYRLFHSLTNKNHVIHFVIPEA